MKFICLKTCSTCKKAQKFLDDHKINYDLIDIRTQNPGLDDLIKYQKLSGLKLRNFFNTSGQKYRDLNLKDRLDGMSDEEMLRLLASDGMLVKRPLLVGEDFCLVGFKEDKWRAKIC